MPETLDASALNNRFDEIRGDFPEEVRLRIRRALSWIERAKKEASDDDARFIFLWIAFNAAYAYEIESTSDKQAESTAFCEYLRKIVDLDHESRISTALLRTSSNPVQSLMGNRFVFQPFWKYHNGIEGFEDWESQFRGKIERLRGAFENCDYEKILYDMFDRLYVLRNQLIHGGATWKSELSREQVGDGAAIMRSLMPIFVKIMMDNPEKDWGKPFYPRVEVPLT